MEQNRQVTHNQATLLTKKALKQFTMSVTITRYTTDESGTIIDDALVPVAEQKAYPFHLFGEFDRQGGYAMSDVIVRELVDTNLFSVYVVGLNTPLFFFSPLNTINGKLKKGDMVFIYVDDMAAPTWFHHVIISATQGGYASLSSLTNITQLDDKNNWGAFQFFEFKYAWRHIKQLDHPMYAITTSYKSAFRADPINPAAYQFVNQKRGVNSIVIDWAMLLNQYTGLSSYLAWENPLLTLSFSVYF